METIIKAWRGGIVACAKRRQSREKGGQGSADQGIAGAPLRQPCEGGDYCPPLWMPRPSSSVLSRGSGFQ